MDVKVDFGRDLFSASYHNLRSTTRYFGIVTSGTTKRALWISIGGTIKHRVFRDVMSEKVSIKNAEHFACYADLILNGITSLYMPLEEILTGPDCT